MGANLALARFKKKMLGFRARASRISSLASGRGGPRYCGGQQSGLKKRLSSPALPPASHSQAIHNAHCPSKKQKQEVISAKCQVVASGFGT
jgi:hypothetical protein